MLFQCHSESLNFTQLKKNNIAGFDVPKIIIIKLQNHYDTQKHSYEIVSYLILKV